MEDESEYIATDDSDEDESADSEDMGEGESEEEVEHEPGQSEQRDGTVQTDDRHKAKPDTLRLIES